MPSLLVTRSPVPQSNRRRHEGSSGKSAHQGQGKEAPSNGGFKARDKHQDKVDNHANHPGLGKRGLRSRPPITRGHLLTSDPDGTKNRPCALAPWPLGPPSFSARGMELWKISMQTAQVSFSSPMAHSPRIRSHLWTRLTFQPMTEWLGGPCDGVDVPTVSG